MQTSLRSLLSLLLVATLAVGIGCSAGGDSGVVSVFEPNDVTLTARIVFTVDATQTKPGVASMLASAMTDRYSPFGDALAVRLEKVGGTVTSEVQHDYLALEVTCAAGMWDALSQTVVSILTDSALQELRMDDLRAWQNESIQLRRADLQQLAESAFLSANVSPELVFSPDGTETTVAEITVEDLREFYSKHITRANFRLGVSGPASTRMAEQLNHRIRAMLPSGERIHPKVLRADIAGLNVRIIESPKATESFVLVGFVAPFSATDTASWILGLAAAFHGAPGTSEQSIDNALRAARGLTRDVIVATSRVNADADGAFWSSGCIMHGDYLMIGASCNPINSLYLTRIILKELTDLNAAGLPEEIMKGMHALLEKNQETLSAAEQMRSVLHQGWLGRRFELTEQSRVFPLSAPSTRKVIRNAFDPANLWVVVVTQNGQQLAAEMLSGTTMYLYPEWVDGKGIQVLDQEYLSYRPFWQADKIRVLKSEELFR